MNYHSKKKDEFDMIVITRRHSEYLVPSDNEIKAIQQDKEVGEKPKAQNMKVVATGGQSTYPFM